MEVLQIHFVLESFMPSFQMLKTSIFCTRRSEVLVTECFHSINPQFCSISLLQLLQCFHVKTTVYMQTNLLIHPKTTHHSFLIKLLKTTQKPPYAQCLPKKKITLKRNYLRLMPLCSLQLHNIRLRTDPHAHFITTFSLIPFIACKALARFFVYFTDNIFLVSKRTQ